MAVADLVDTLTEERARLPRRCAPDGTVRDVVGHVAWVALTDGARRSCARCCSVGGKVHPVIDRRQGVCTARSTPTGPVAKLRAADRQPHRHADDQRRVADGRHARAQPGHPSPARPAPRHRSGRVAGRARSLRAGQPLHRRPQADEGPASRGHRPRLVARFWPRGDWAPPRRSCSPPSAVPRRSPTSTATASPPSPPASDPVLFTEIGGYPPISVNKTGMGGDPLGAGWVSPPGCLPWAPMRWLLGARISTALLATVLLSTAVLRRDRCGARARRARRPGSRCRAAAGVTAWA